MNVDFSSTNLVNKVWFDASTGRLCVAMDTFQNSIPLAEIPDGDFQSTAAITRFSIGQNGAVVVCHHKDGAETWLPADLWMPRGFELPSRSKL
jgi:hypothetical protein